MALINDGESLTFLSIFGGRFEKRLKEPTETSTWRTTKDGKSICVQQYRGVSGKITGLLKKTHDYQGQVFTSLNITVDDGESKFVISLPYESDLARTFFQSMENIDYDKEVVFTASESKNDKGKDVTNLFISQDKKNVERKYTKKWQEANPGVPSSPQWKKLMYKNKEVWDNTDEVLFFEAIMAKIVAKLPQQQNAHTSASSTPAANVVEKVTNDDIPAYKPDSKGNMVPDDEPVTDDLPF